MKLAALLLCCGLLAACAPREPVKLGFLGGLSGRVADLGEAGRDGTQLAVEEANATGGINGRPIELFIEDDGQDAQKALSAIDKLAGIKVVAVIGPMTSAMAVAVLEPSAQAGLLLVSPTVTASTLSDRDDNLFKVVSSTRAHARLSAESVFALGQRRIACIYDTNNAAYTKDWLEQFRAAFEARGGVVSAVETFTSGVDASYSAAVHALKPAAADSLHFIANATDTVRLLQLSRAAGLTQPASAATWAATEQLIELGGRWVENLYLTQYFDRDDLSPRYVKFRDLYRGRFRQEPGFASIAAYDATRAVIEALRKQAPRHSLKSALLSSGPYEGIQGQWNFDRSGDANRSAWMTVVRNGRFVRAD